MRPNRIVNWRLNLRQIPRNIQFSLQAIDGNTDTPLGAKYPILIMIITTLLLTFLAFPAAAQFKIPDGVKVKIKPGQDFTFDNDKGVFLDKAGMPIMPPPGTYEFDLPTPKNSSIKANSPSDNNSSSAAQKALDREKKVRAPSTVSDIDPGSVSNYAPPKGNGSITSSTVNHTGINMDRVRVSEQKPISLFAKPSKTAKELSPESQQELNELKSILHANVSKVRDLQKALKHKTLKPGEYQSRLRDEILPHIANYQSRIAAKKASTKANSYYQGILQEQLSICASFTNTIQNQLRAPASAAFPAVHPELNAIERRILLLALKYEVMDKY